MTDPNPFSQPEALMLIRVTVPVLAALAVEEALEEFALASSRFEATPDGTIWTVEVHADAAYCPEEEIRGAVRDVCARLRLDTPEVTIARLAPTNWLEEVAKRFAPVSAGRFFVHPAHHRALAPAGGVRVQVEAGMAFGSGEHETTKGCLLAIDRLARQRKFCNMLDMGCGSAILAIALAKTYAAPVLAVDVDPISVRVSRENAQINGVTRFVRAVCGDGYRAREVSASAPYDLIVANILAKPLVKMAPALARVLAPDGVAILSGLLNRQEKEVLAAHREQGIFLRWKIQLNGWSVLVLGR